MGRRRAGDALGGAAHRGAESGDGGDFPHGGGCTLSALITGRLACGEGLEAAVRWSKERLSRAIAGSVRVGEGLRVLPLD
ncbi:MAG: bifunctional hydroxymethylpyrimidine kinase/phosphomethylpyrimidine kinase [Deltaproteobacteria bacterium]|nr:bifunctional hydroxymethylpyrimidine kinase/phosphomethylpyrimidine kinase [Deltaproteobacteria bacterium]